MAAEFQAAADAAERAGKIDEWEILQRRAWMAADMAEEREKVPPGKGLPVGNNPSNISGEKVTAAQLKRRGAAVARGKAVKGGQPVSIAISTSKWKSQDRYAKERLRISQPALSRYIRGGLPCPRFVADAVKDDFGLDYGVWPKGVVD